MAKTSRMRRVLGAAAASAAFAAGTVVAFPGAAQAADADRYYIQVGGTGPTKPAPECTYTYDPANAAHQLGDRAIKVCYPASWGPVIGPTGSLVEPNGKINPEALTAPTYDTSVRIGIEETLKVAEETHRAHPDAQLRIVGYSQGAHVADEVLQKISRGETGIPKEQVDGKLYADPMQPGTGFFAVVPKGIGVPGVATSAGAGPTDFNGIPVTRYCINGDPVCDANILNAPGYFELHPNYAEGGNAIERTMTEDSPSGVQWLNPDGTPAPPRG
ncbi:cutinase family protein [Streptomyces luteolus]|uniref:PE-PPE domain-containing protein n=1 Tax=Streptomyces luteolus TaxID=3043615 RepID=A0ABT6T091_9ACTN|nr:PE-PPE domain-containing protein [Streptomyces sp. B-S-A12]MDI3421256.1 PE-PPE domain-containing protein [Streptomyces sp. B-S-A12]